MKRMYDEKEFDKVLEEAKKYTDEAVAKAGGKLYIHNIRFQNAGSSACIICISIYTSSNTAFTKASLSSFLYNKGYKSYTDYYTASGYYTSSSVNNDVVGIASSNGTTLSVVFLNNTNQISIDSLNASTFDDTVNEV